MGRGRLDTWSGPNQGWTTVFSGPLQEALVCRGLLEANGILTQAVNETLMVVDWGVIGGGDALSVHLQVPEASAGEAREMLAWRPPEAEAGERAEPTNVQAEELGRRIHWASITGITAPYALWLAPQYVRALRGVDRPPKNHGWTLAAIVFSFVVTLLFGGLLVESLYRHLSGRS